MNADSRKRARSLTETNVIDVKPADFLKSRGLTEKIIGIFYEVYNELGFGFLEAVYEQAMSIALEQSGFKVQRQAPIPVWFRGCKIADYKADILVENEVLLELKAARSIDAAFEKQILNYLRATDVEVGLLLNFGHKPEFRRLVFENKRKIRVNPR